MPEKQASQSNQKVGKRLKQTFLQRRHTDGYWTHEKMISITHYYRKTKPQWDTTSHHSEWPSSKGPETISGEGVEKRECSFPVGGNVNGCSHHGRWYGGSLKN